MIKAAKFFVGSSQGYRNNSCESNSGVSDVVPDMSLSMRDLINRHMSGGKVRTFSDAGIPTGSSVIPGDLERMSLIDRAQLAKELPHFIRTTRGAIVSARQARKEAALRIQADEAAAKGGTTVGAESPQPPAGVPLKAKPTKDE